jgi:hypothetical protein
MIHIRVLEATGITPDSTMPYCHPYVRVSHRQLTIRTRAVDKHQHPHWNQDLHFQIVDEDCTEIIFDLVSSDPFGSDTKLASCKLTAARLALGALIDEWFTFLPGPDTRVHMKLHRAGPFELPFNEEPNPQENTDYRGGPREIVDGTDDDGGDFGFVDLFRQLISQVGEPTPRAWQGSGASWFQQLSLGDAPGLNSGMDEEEEEQEGRVEPREHEEEEEEEEVSDFVEVSRNALLGREGG